jgi:archaellum component FlaC
MADPMSHPITRGELHEALETWTGALIARLDERFAKIDERFAKIDERFAKIDERFARIDERFAKIDERFARIETELGAFATKEDLARHANAMMEHTASLIRVIDDKYKDLPARMDRVERAVYKRTKRAPSRSPARRRR